MFCGGVVGVAALWKRCVHGGRWAAVTADRERWFEVANGSAAAASDTIQVRVVGVVCRLRDKEASAPRGPFRRTAFPSGLEAPLLAERRHKLQRGSVCLLIKANICPGAACGSD